MGSLGEYILVCLVIFIRTSYGLSCYQCRSSKVSDCTTDDLHQRIVSCGAPNPDFVQFCLFKVVFDFPLQTTVASSSCENVRKTPMQNWQSIERDYCQSGYSQQVHQCRICLSDLCNNPAIPYLQNAGPGPYLQNVGPGPYLQNTGPGSYSPNYGLGPFVTNTGPGPYIPNTGAGGYGYIPSPPRPPLTYSVLYGSAPTPVVLRNSPCLALGVAAIVHLITN